MYVLLADGSEVFGDTKPFELSCNGIEKPGSSEANIRNPINTLPKLAVACNMR